MPEMPEVQSVIDSLLEQEIVNKKITNVEIYMEKILKNSSVDNFKNFLLKESITNITRKGKYLIFHLTHKKILVIHLRMEGKLFFVSTNNEIPTRHILVKIQMKDQELIYHDTRRFGTFTIYDEDTYLKSKELSKLALDPLEEGFDWKYLKNNFKNSTRYVKSIILDQTIVAGIGNIYADEILFASKINPYTKGKDLTDQNFKDIVINAKDIMTRAIKNKGTTISSYYYKKDKMGEFQKFLLVHTKKSKPCVNCKKEIIKVKVNGRGTYICEHCQKPQKD